MNNNSSFFDLSNASIPGNAKRAPKEKLKPGRYVVVVQDVKEINSQMSGQGFIVDFAVESGPMPAGHIGDYKVYPHDAKGGGRMPRDQAFQRELGKIKRAVAAICGLDVSQVGQIDNARYQAAIARPLSPLKGRKVVVESVPWTNAKGESTVYYELFPYSEPGASLTSTVDLARNKAPSLPKKQPSFEELLKAHGFEIHPDDAEYVFNAATEECITVAEFKSRLSF